MDYCTYDNGQLVNVRSGYENLSSEKKALLDEKAGDGALARRPIIYEGEGPKWTETVEPTRVLRTRFTPDAPSLSDLKKSLQSDIDMSAGAVRSKFISQGAGMEMTYQEKFAQANAVDAMGEVAANALSQEDRVTQFPVLAASVGIEAETLYDCAQLVINKYSEWAMLANVIEGIRLGGKKSVSDSASVNEAQAAYDTASQSFQAILNDS